MKVTSVLFFRNWFKIFYQAWEPLLNLVQWRLLPRAAARLAGWAWVLPFATLGWLAGVVIKAGRAAVAGLRLGYRSGDRR